MIHYKNDEEVELLREGALSVSATLTEVAKMLKPGVKTIDIDRLAETFIRDNGGVPTFKGFGVPGNQFPYSLCISVNEVVVHGFPSDYELQEDDIISVDCGVLKNGFNGDHAFTFALAGVKPEVLDLVNITKESLYKGIEQAVVGNRIGDISSAIEEHTFGVHGYGVVRELVGHGVGKDMHEDPQVPNYGRKGRGKKLKNNLTLAIEPMINLGTRHVYTREDGWTVATEDGLPSVHFEHDVCVKKGKADILSNYLPIEKEVEKNDNLIASTPTPEILAKL